MAVRRYNSKKIASTPSLKKRMAKFCAQIDIEFSYAKPKWEEILYKGHRGYISYSEDDLAKEFDKRVHYLRDKYSAMKANEEESKLRNDRWYRKSDDFVAITLWYEEGVEIANEVFEDKFFS